MTTKSLALHMKLVGLFLVICLFWSCVKDKTADISCSSATVVSYKNGIQPILDFACNSCHNYPGTGGIYLDSFQMTHDLALNGTLLGVIKGEPNYLMMPPYGYPQLDSCQMALLASWIANGAPNN